MNFSVIVAGVAEQPVFWTAQVLSKIAFNRGYNVYFSGSPEARAGKGVMAQVRWGKGKLSSVVPRGDCQFVIGLEPLEAARVSFAHYTLNMQVVSTDVPLIPTSVVHNGATYPEVSEMFRRLEAEGISSRLVGASSKMDLKQMAMGLLLEVKLGEKSLVQVEELEIVLEELGEGNLFKDLVNVKKSS